MANVCAVAKYALVSVIVNVSICENYSVWANESLVIKRSVLANAEVIQNNLQHKALRIQVFWRIKFWEKLERLKNGQIRI